MSNTVHLTQDEVTALMLGSVPPSVKSKLPQKMPALRINLHLLWRPESWDEFDPDNFYRNLSATEALLASFCAYAGEGHYVDEGIKAFQGDEVGGVVASILDWSLLESTNPGDVSATVEVLP